MKVGAKSEIEEKKAKKRDFSNKIIDLLKRNKSLSLDEIHRDISVNKITNEGLRKNLNKLIANREIYYIGRDDESRQSQKRNRWLLKKIFEKEDIGAINRIQNYYFLTPYTKTVYVELNKLISNVSSQKLAEIIKRITVYFRFLEYQNLTLEKRVFNEKAIKRHLEKKGVEPSEENVKNKIESLKEEMEQFYESLRPLREEVSVNVICEDFSVHNSNNLFLINKNFQSVWNAFKIKIKSLFIKPEKTKLAFIVIGNMIVFQMNPDTIKQIDKEFFIKSEDVLVPLKELGAFYSIIYKNMPPFISWFAHTDKQIKEEIINIIIDDMFSFYIEREKVVKMKTCEFCNLGIIEKQKIYETKNEFVIYNIRPTTKGQCLVIPKKHVTNIRELSKDELSSLINTIQFVSEKLNSNLTSIGFNYGFNEGEFAGQSIKHFHFHILPRYQDDKALKFHLFHRDPKNKKNLDELELKKVVDEFKKIFR